MNLLERLRMSWGIARELRAIEHGQRKGRDILPYSRRWQQTSWLDPSWEHLTGEGYNANAAVAACIRALAFAFPEPRPLVLDQTNERLPDHALLKLLNRPNPLMSHSELLAYVIVYMAIGGQCYLYKVRNSAGQTIGLWPYHAGYIMPVPGEMTWIDHYDYMPYGMQKQAVPAEDIIHLKWPLPDTEQPWLALPPLRQVAREVDSDTEMTRMLYSFLKNDARVPMVINLPAGTNLTETEYNVFIARFMARHGGDNRGLPAVVEGASSIERMGLNLKDLDMTVLRGVPEARICATFGVPPEVAMLTVGMAHSTENNLYAADVRFTTRTLVPLWRGVSDELTQDLGVEYPGNIHVAYDIQSIQALQENETERWKRGGEAYDRNSVTKNEFRAYIGFGPVGQIAVTDAGDVFADGSVPAAKVPELTDATPEAKDATPILGYHIEQGVVSRNESRAQLGLPPEDESLSDVLRRLQASLAVVSVAVGVGIPLDIALKLVRMDVTLPEPTEVLPAPKQLTDHSTKARIIERKASATAAVTERMRKDVEKYLVDQFADYADAGGVE